MYSAELLLNKRIMVTGAGSGIGRETAIKASSCGAKLILVGRNPDKLAETMSMMNGEGHTSIATDLTVFDEYSNVFLQATHDGKIDGLIHCAGIAKPIPLKVLNEKNIDEIFNINFKSLVLLVKYFQKKNISNDAASVVYCSAINAHINQQKCMELYESSKLAAEGFVRGIAAELYSGRKLRINSMVIGPVATPMAGLDNNSVGVMSEISPNLTGIISAEDVANSAIYLVSSLSNMMTGRELYIDGGVGLSVYG